MSRELAAGEAKRHRGDVIGVAENYLSGVLINLVMAA
jgi:hypothetical protein